MSTFALIFCFLVVSWTIVVAAGYAVGLRNREPMPSLMGRRQAAVAYGHGHGSGGPKSVLKLVGALFYLPALALSALLSIPYSWIRRVINERGERQFALRMQMAGRLKLWSEVRSAAVEKRGTLVVESLSIKGPSRLWWTSDEVPDISPFPFVASNDIDRICYSIEFREFGKWWFQHYSSPDSGKALFVKLPQAHRKEFWREVKSAGFISAYSREAEEARDEI